MNDILLFLIYIVTFLLVGYIAYKFGENKGYEQGRFDNKIAAKKAAATPTPVVTAPMLVKPESVAVPVLPVKPAIIENKVHIITPAPVPVAPASAPVVVASPRGNIFYMKALPKGVILKLTR